jgi:hypothetical protein
MLWTAPRPRKVKWPCKAAFSAGGEPYLHLYLHSNSGGPGMAFQGATLRVRFWPEPSKWDDRRRRSRSRCNSPSPRSSLRRQTELLQNSPTGQPDSRNAMAMAISVAAQRADRPSYGFRGSATFGVRFGGSLGSHEASQLKIRFVPFELMVRVASRRRARILLSTHANVN